MRLSVEMDVLGAGTPNALGRVVETSTDAEGAEEAAATGKESLSELRA